MPDVHEIQEEFKEIVDTFTRKDWIEILLGMIVVQFSIFYSQTRLPTTEGGFVIFCLSVVILYLAMDNLGMEKPWYRVAISMVMSFVLALILGWAWEGIPPMDMIGLGTDGFGTITYLAWTLGMFGGLVKDFLHGD